MMLESKILREYRAVREDIGLIDRSEVGKLALRGADRISWLQGMVSNDVRLLEQGASSLQACVLDATGHLLTDLTLIHLTGANPLAEALGFSEPDFILAELPRMNVEKIAAIFDRYLIMEDVEISDVSDALACFSLQGPHAQVIWHAPHAGSREPWEQIWRSAYAIEADHTGNWGFDLFFSVAHKEAMHSALLDADILDIGPEAQEILRVEAGIPQYGADMDESVLAPEANLGPTHISLTKGCYVGQEIVARIDSRGHTNRALTHLLALDTAPPAPGDKLYTIATPDEPTPREVGRLTSVIACSPAMDNRPLALGYVRHEHRTPGTRLRAGDTVPKRFLEVLKG